jgi:cytosine/adenosine deaminase-related metal-dependent hydrolase
MIRTFKADLIITNDGPPLRNGYVDVNSEGVIVSIGEESSSSNITEVSGIITPGFVNSHCHLELSHLKGKVKERTDGMSGFIKGLFAERFSSSDEEMAQAMFLADKEMHDEGIVAVGDISNFDISLPIKQKSSIYYHTFVEVVGQDPSKAYDILEKAMLLRDEYIFNTKGSASVVPHAPYSMSRALISAVNKEAFHKSRPVSIHMQESDDEFLFCKDKSGPLSEFFLGLGLNIRVFDNISDACPMLNTLPLLTDCKPLMMVHNTLTTAAQIDIATALHNDLYWCLCPNANNYITGRLPHLCIYNNDELKVTVGTDSLASNHRLSILDELKTIAAAHPEIPFERLIKWATINGAEFLGIDKKFGKIKAGMTPGLVQIDNVNIENLVLNGEGKSKLINWL